MKKLLAVVAALCTVFCLFAGCKEEEKPIDVATATPVSNATPAPTEVPELTEEEKANLANYCMDGGVLKSYIGNETTVKIPKGTVTIDTNAFRGRTDIEAVDFSEAADTLINIGDYAFYGCTSLKEVSLSRLVKNVGEYAFAECTALTKYESKTDASNLGKYAFYNCSALTTATLSTNVSVINEGLFEGCKALTSIAINNAKEVNDRAFYGCEALSSISANVLLTVNDEVFAGCKALSDVSGISSITSIGTDVFKDTAWLDGAIAKADAPTAVADAYVTVGKGILVYYSNAEVVATEAPSADATEVPATEVPSEGAETATPAPKELVLDSSVKVIGPNSLAACADEIEVVKLSSSVIALGEAAFKDFSKLQYVELSSQITTIPEYAFANCTELTTVVMPGNVEVIGDYAFDGCTKLSAITLFAPQKPEATETPAADATEAPTADATEAPAADATEAPAADSTEAPVADATETPKLNADGALCQLDFSKAVTTIGDYAFRGCVAVEEILLSDKVTSIGQYAFADCSALDVKDAAAAFTASLNYVGVNAFAGTPWFDAWNGIVEAPETEENDTAIAEDDDTAAADVVAPNKNHLIIGNGVLIKVIGNDYDGKYTGVKTIAVELDGVDTVADKLFYNNTALVDVIIPEGVTSIGDYAFYCAENLRSIVIPSTVTSIGEKAFYGCKNLETIILPEGITEISDYAFYGCAKLTELVIPSTVTKIGDYAFYNSIELEKIDVPAGVAEVGAFAFSNTRWIEIAADKLVVVGDGILVKYNAYVDEFTFTAEDPAVKVIAGGAFEGAYMLKNITLPETVTEIGAFAFSGCTTVEKVISSAVAVGERAFNYCTALTSAEFADGATVAEDAFHGCTAIEE